MALVTLTPTQIAGWPEGPVQGKAVTDLVQAASRKAKPSIDSSEKRVRLRFFMTPPLLSRRKIASCLLRP
jgi:hypothetical protein